MESFKKKINGKLLLLMSVEGIANKLYFNQDFLQEGGTSDQFFEAVSYPVDLHGMSIFIKIYLELYIVRGTCFYHALHSYCPVLIEIIDARLKENYKGNFLM
jgi:hypothetical protein